MDTHTAAHDRVLGSGHRLFDDATERLSSLRRLGRDDLFALPEGIALSPEGDVVVNESSDGMTLAQLLARKGQLSIGECVAVGTAIAAALDVLHHAGLAHAALSASSVVCGPHGNVRLGRLLDSVAVPEDRRTAPQDVSQLGALLLEAVSITQSARLEAWIEPMLAPDPAARPSAGVVAKALVACAPTAPVALPPADVAGGFRVSLGRGTRRSNGTAASTPTSLPSGEAWRAAKARLRRRAVVGLGVVGVVCALMGGWRVLSGTILSGEAQEAAPSGTVVASQVHEPEPETAESAAARLTMARIDAIARADPEGVLALTAPSSPARTGARAVAAAIESGELNEPDAKARIVAVESMGQSAGGLALVAVDYTWAPGESEKALLALVKTRDGGWLVAMAVDARNWERAGA